MTSGIKHIKFDGDNLYLAVEMTQNPRPRFHGAKQIKWRVATEETRQVPQAFL